MALRRIYAGWSYLRALLKSLESLTAKTVLHRTMQLEPGVGVEGLVVGIDKAFTDGFVFQSMTIACQVHEKLR